MVTNIVTLSMGLLLAAYELHAEVAFQTPENIDQELERAKDKLLPNLGVHFKNLKKLITNRDQVYLTLGIPLPDFRTFW